LRYGDNADLRQLLTLMGEYRQEALACAARALAYEALPYPYRASKKAQRGHVYQQRYMASQEATDKQRALLAKLGYTGPIESRLHASRLMDARLSGVPQPVGVE
jgi:hypothetical protein